MNRRRPTSSASRPAPSHSDVLPPLYPGYRTPVARRAGGRWAAAAGLLALVLPGCSSGHRSGGASSTTGSSPSSTTAAAAKALVAALPEGCDGGAPAPGAVVAFVAGGRSWAVSPDVPASLHCLFATPDAGLFSFGP